MDLVRLRTLADKFDARILCDAAHLAGIIAGGRFQNPLVEGADILTISTYKVRKVAASSVGGRPRLGDLASRLAHDYEPADHIHELTEEVAPYRQSFQSMRFAFAA
jgi:hypothetical protein